MDSREVLPPRMLLDGSYRIIRVVGSGGFGITYEAEDINLGTMVAIKEYYPYDFGERAGTMSVRAKSDRHKKTFDWGRANFLQEARTLARFEHPSIVRVTRVFEANSTAYMVMRFERGKSFEDWLRGLGRLPTQDELDRIVAPMLDALQMLHAADFLHRDIAPDNIIVRADGTPVLLDFGAARRAVAEMSQALTGIVKAGYSPHEQYSSDGRLQGPWSDLYALGGTLYRAVTGKPPEEATMRFDEDRMVPAVRAGKGKYRPSFLAAIDMCLKVRHAERPRSVAQLRPMLLGDEEKARARNRLADTLKPASKPQPLPPPKTRRVSTPVQPGRSRQWPTIAAAIVAILGGAYGGYQFTHWQSVDSGNVDAESKRQAEAEKLRKQEEEAKRQADTEKLRKQLEDAKRQADAEKLRKQQEDAKRQADAERLRKQQEEDAKRQAEAEKLRKQQEEDAKRQTDAERLRKQQEEAKRQADAEKLRKQQEEAKRQAEAEKLRKQQEEDAKRQTEAERLRKQQEEAKRQADAERLRKQQEEAKRQADAERLRKQQEEDAKRRAEAERLRKQQEEEAKRRAEAESLRKQQEEEAKRRAEAESLRKQQEERQALLDLEKRRKTEPEVDRAKTLIRDCGICPDMVAVPAGQFTMGSSKSDIDSGAAAGNEGPQRRVVIKQSLAVGRFEVTRDEFEQFVRASGHKVGDKCWTLEGNEPKERDGRSFRNPGYTQVGTHPAVCVSWEDAKAYVAWLSKATGKTYRLPSESQWEYVARAGTNGRYGSANTEADLCAIGNGADQSASAANLPPSWDYLRCSDGHVHTAPVGSFRPNAFGLFDLTGNAWEWVEDCFAESLDETPTDGQARTSSDCQLHAVRGGAWSATARMLRLPVRGKAPGTYRFDDVGFRVVRTLEP